MFAELLARLTGHTPQKPLPELDARLAVGALLVRVAKTDQHYAFEEIVQIDKILASRFGLNPVEAARMRADCERLASAAPDSSEFTAMVHNAVPYSERAALLDALWQVSLADRALKPEEDAFLGRIAGALGIADGDAAGIANRHKS
jgi:uncharacterized tellurite resistance protein B-like protein